MDYDFSGYATRNDLECSDGRTIRKGAFSGCSGKVVPLVWQHQHNSIDNLLGHAMLEEREDGMYAYGTFNDTPQGKNAKIAVMHGDVEALSIFANGLKQERGNVLHGTIREVSLVLAGANPGAFIDYIALEHGEGGEPTEAIIFTDELIDPLPGEIVEHSESKDSIENEQDSVKEEAINNKEVETIQHADDASDKNDAPAKGKTVQDVIDEMTPEGQKVVKIMTIAGAEAARQELIEKYNLPEKADDPLEEEENTNDEEGEVEEMKHNAFDDSNEYVGTVDQAELTHSQIQTIFDDAKKSTLKTSFLAHADEYGIKDIDWLFPEAKTFQDKPEFISRKMDWVSTVMNGVHKSPFSRIKSMFADITADEARAKGYIKGDLKENEVFTLLRRTTEPCTIYKKQTLDRDDIVDITDFDVVAWIKAEMRVMLDEEIARAILVGDGRLTSDRTHIPEDHVRPIWKEADLFCIKKEIPVGKTDDETAKNFIKTAIKARKDYRGSGNPILFTTEDYLTDMLLLEDSIGHSLYDTESALATKIRVSKIETVPVMENLTRPVTKGGQAYTNTLRGIIVNLNDYNVGADKGGSVNMFDDFDIDFNQMKYLIETRISGALTKPFSAIVLETSVQGAG